MGVKEVADKIVLKTCKTVQRYKCELLNRIGKIKFRKLVYKVKVTEDKESVS